MLTIVKYTDCEIPVNEYPQRIVSPVRSGPCCFSDMEEIGTVQREGRWEFRYRRCRHCGFAVRVILRELLDPLQADQLREILAHAFVRKVPDL